MKENSPSWYPISGGYESHKLSTYIVSRQVYIESDDISRVGRRKGVRSTVGRHVSPYARQPPSITQINGHTYEVHYRRWHIPQFRVVLHLGV